MSGWSPGPGAWFFLRALEDESLLFFMNLTFGFSPAFILLIVLIAGALTWLMYKGTGAILPPWAKGMLSLFRFLVISFIAILLLDPLINTQSRVTYPPIVAVLQDVSESVVLQKDSAFVRTEYPGLLKQFLGNFDKGPATAELFSFASSLNADPSPDSLRFAETGTNISRAMEEVGDLYQNQNLGAIVLISDGISTAGVNPLYALDGIRQPVYTVLIGDTTGQKDIRISEVLYNEIAYLNSESPVKVKVQSQGYENADLKITLSGDGKVLGTESLKLSRNRPQGEVDFLIKPVETGVRQYRIEVSPMKEEISYRNNSRQIFITVLETRVKIALFGGSPHPDIGALRQALQRDDSYELQEFILKGPGRYYQDPGAYNLRDFDLFILHNFPQSSADREMVEKIASELRDRKKPAMFFVGMFTDLTTMEPLYDYMGVTPKGLSPKADEVILNFSRDYENHSTFTFPDNWISWVNATPPLYRNKSNWIPKSTTEVFATARIKNIPLNYPVYALQSHLGRKNMVFLGENFWRMRAFSFTENDSFDYFDDWLFNNIKWLRVSDDKRKFKVEPSKKLFTGSEAARFRGQVYDDSYNPIPGVEIRLSVKSPDGKENVYFMNETTRAQYFLELFNLEEGTYNYSAEGKKNEIGVGSDRGQFSVGKSNVEHFRLQADQDLLKQIALRSGGAFISAKDLPELAMEIQALPALKPLIDYKTGKHGFHRYAWVMGLLLAFLAIEWVVRKWFSLL
jgi:hypothetical protein